MCVMSSCQVVCLQFKTPFSTRKHVSNGNTCKHYLLSMFPSSRTHLMQLVVQVWQRIAVEEEALMM